MMWFKVHIDFSSAHACSVMVAQAAVPAGEVVKRSHSKVLMIEMGRYLV